MMARDWGKQGKQNRRKGGEWERKVREDLREGGWIVDKWSSNIDLFIQGDEVIGGEFITAKPKFNAFRKAMSIGTGFPDFLCFKQSKEREGYELMFVECKTNGTLSKEEKEKMAWLEGEGYCCWVAGKDKDGDVCYEKPKKTKARLKLEKEKNE